MALVYVTLMLPVIMGFALLAIDVGRVYILQSSLQHGADALALAMAAELDRGNDAITRAQRAKANMVANPATFSDSFQTINAASVTTRFLSSLPASDQTAIDNSYVTTNPSLARYVEVTVNAAQYNTVFPAAFINVAGSLSTSATAVAGFDAGACNITPMFMCNPLEPSGNTDPYRITELQNHIATNSLRRRLFELKAFANSSGQSQFSPGNFGYIETPLGPGARSLADAISQAEPKACAQLTALTTKPGNTNVASDAFNVRFDMYGGSFKRNDETIRPARNTRKSWVPAQNGNNKDCNPTEVTDLYTTNWNVNKTPPAMGFPRDSCQVAGNCGSGFGGRIGNGDWNGMFSIYMATNFGKNSSAWPKKSDGSSFSTSDLPTRYEVYRAEIEQNKVNSASMATPACYNGSTTPNDSPDRRMIFAAIANCIAQPIGSGSTTVKAAAIGEFFISEPVGSQGSVYAELVSIIKPGDVGGDNAVKITDNIQLYR